jgi:copper chaperone
MKNTVLFSMLSLVFLSAACNTAPTETAETTEAPVIQAAETITLSISGMDCEGCVKSVTEALKGVEGVAEVEVSLENHTATVTGTSVDLFLLAAAADSAGYGATPIDPNALPVPVDSSKTENRSQHGEGSKN